MRTNERATNEMSISRQAPYVFLPVLRRISVYLTPLLAGAFFVKNKFIDVALEKQEEEEFAK